MNSIGGYFGLELNNRMIFPHSDGVCLNSGKNALEHILLSLPDISKLYIPYYTCDVVYAPLKKLKIPYSFYSVNVRLEIAEEPTLNSNEYILYTNYFGIKDRYTQVLAEKYDKHLIIDNAQALFAPRIQGIKTIYSPRKFVGVPDGGIAFVDTDNLTAGYEQDVSYNRFAHLLKRHDLGAEAGYDDFKENSRELAQQPIKYMSRLTTMLLSSIDYSSIIDSRIHNFNTLHNTLGSINQMQIPTNRDYACPLVYPFYTSDGALRAKLISKHIYVARYWPNVLDMCAQDSIDYQLADKIIAIPVDQRYNHKDMDRIINEIKYA